MNKFNNIYIYSDKHFDELLFETVLDIVKKLTPIGI